MTAWGKLIRREFITGNDLYFCEGLLHEDDMWRVCAARQVRSVAFCFTPVYFYRNDNADSIIHRKDKTLSFVSRLKIIGNMVDGFGQSDYKGECRYLFDALQFAGKAQAWECIGDKALAGSELRRLDRMARKSRLPGLFRFMIRYLTLPVMIGDSMFVRPFYLSFINRSFNRLMAEGE